MKYVYALIRDNCENTEFMNYSLDASALMALGIILQEDLLRRLEVRDDVDDD